MDEAILNARPDKIDRTLAYETSDYLGYLHLATVGSEESYIDNFCRETLRLLGFSRDAGLTLSTRHRIPLKICSVSSMAQTDVCLIHRPSMILLVVLEDKTLYSPKIQHAESQVIAEAIAAFQFNNAKRVNRALPALPSMTIPCITMTGTRPTFYLVPVTKDLSDAFEMAAYPVEETKVFKCVTALRHTRGHQRHESDGSYGNEGMHNTKYRKLALQRFLAFKTLAESHWRTILEDFDT